MFVTSDIFGASGQRAAAWFCLEMRILRCGGRSPESLDVQRDGADRGSQGCQSGQGQARRWIQVRREGSELHSSLPQDHQQLRLFPTSPGSSAFAFMLASSGSPGGGHSSRHGV